MDCQRCNDSGSLPGSSYLDCPSCDAAEKRIALNDFVSGIRQTGFESFSDLHWAIHQRSAQIEHEAQAARIAALQAQVKELEQKHAAAVERFEELASMPGAPSAPAVEQQPIGYTSHGNLVRLQRGLAAHDDIKPALECDYPIAIYAAPQAADTDKVREADTLMRAAIDCAHVIEADRIVLKRDTKNPGNALHQLHERLKVASMAAQAPVREVPENWIACSDRLPDMDSLVWLFDADIGAFIGERNDTGDGWLWGRAENYYQDKHGDWQSRDCEQDDFNITHWQPLPALPASPVQQEGETP